MTRWARRLTGLLVVALVSGALPVTPGAETAQERAALARVRLTTEAGLADGCTRLGAVRDDSIADLRRKVVKLGGNTAVLSFGGSENLAVIFGDVFRCGDPGSPATTAPGTAPARLPLPAPPPPPGPPR